MRLLPYTDADFGLTAALERDPRVMGELGGPVAPELVQSIHNKRLAGAASGDWFYTIVPDGAPNAVGLVGVWRTNWEGGIIRELGLLLLPNYQRRGLAAQAVRLILDRAGTERAFEQVHVFPAVTNTASNAVSARLGFTLLGQCELDYEGRALVCNHWVLSVPPAAVSDGR